MPPSPANDPHLDSSSASKVLLDPLLNEFYGKPDHHGQLGSFSKVTQLPAPFGKLLDHDQHMTVTIEAFCAERVKVHVHRHHTRENWYSREITLVTETSGQIVQYGIVRLDTTALVPAVWQKIESQETPLGRVLIQNNVLRKVQLCHLWSVQAGPCLAERLHEPIGKMLYGRTALIHCNGKPAIELLEILSSRI